jgi:hypothetical protein
LQFTELSGRDNFLTKSKEYEASEDLESTWGGSQLKGLHKSDLRMIFENHSQEQIGCCIMEQWAALPYFSWRRVKGIETSLHAVRGKTHAPGPWTTVRDAGLSVFFLSMKIVLIFAHISLLSKCHVWTSQIYQDD